jgi:2-polyprenyl-6-methoxyphenol hydroxylase-like FAD-dependent oxidoreductase
MRLTRALCLCVWVLLIQAAWALEPFVITGGGPGGLAAAIRLRQLGHQVVLLEGRHRDYIRRFHLGLRAESLARLDQLGVLDDVAERSGYSPAEVQEWRRNFRPSKSPEEMLAGSTLAYVRMNDLEEVLYKRAGALGVDLRYGRSVVLSQWPDVMIHRGVMDERGKFWPQGEPEQRLRPELLIVAQGVHSQTRADLGIEVQMESTVAWFMGMLWDGPSQAEAQRMVRLREEGFVQHVVAIGHRRYPQTWALVQVPEEVALQPEQSRLRYACAQLSELLDAPVSPHEIVWGGFLSKVQNRRAVRVVKGNAVLFGDAARSGFAWSSSGANLALSADLQSLETLVSDIESGRADAFARFEASLQQASSAWLKADGARFERSGAQSPSSGPR